MPDTDPFAIWQDTAPAPGGMLPEAQKAGVQDVAPASIAGVNPVLQAGVTLLRLGACIRSGPQPCEVETLRSGVTLMVRRFDAMCRRQGVPDDQVVAARYLVCTFLDESVLGTAWGASGSWSQHSLLITFHNENWGGEKVFKLGAKLCEDPSRYAHVLELLYVVLALGLKGQYAIRERGREQLDSVGMRLATLLRQNVPAHEPELSPRWHGAPAAVSRLRDGVPVWVVAAVVAFVMMLVFTASRFKLDDASEPVFAALESLDAANAERSPVPAALANAVSPSDPRLSRLLGPDIDKRLIDVRDMADRSVVVVRGDGFFAEGQADVADSFMPLVKRIADALAQVPGAVLVTGHTDGQPIRSLRYPSNWHLSQERAKAVGILLAMRVDATRIRTEGRADAEPLADNQTAAGRARNRRVEVTLLVSPRP